MYFFVLNLPNHMLKQSKRLLRTIVCLCLTVLLFFSSPELAQAQTLLANTQVRHTSYPIRAIESGGAVLVGCGGVVAGISFFFPPIISVAPALCSGLAFHATIPPALMTDAEYEEYVKVLRWVQIIGVSSGTANTLASPRPVLQPR